MARTLNIVSVFICGLLGLAVLSACTTPPTSADEVDNPLFHFWPSQAGAQMQFDRILRISGGVPVPDAADQVFKSVVTFKVAKSTSTELVIEVSEGTQVDSFSIPAKIAPDLPSFPKFVKDESVTLGEKTYACQVYSYQTTSSAEVGRDTQGLPAQVTVWVSPDVLGGVVRREIALTIKASYNIEDIVSSPASTGTGQP